MSPFHGILSPLLSPASFLFPSSHFLLYLIFYHSSYLPSLLFCCTAFPLTSHHHFPFLFSVSFLSYCLSFPLLSFHHPFLLTFPHPPFVNPFHLPSLPLSPHLSPPFSSPVIHLSPHHLFSLFSSITLLTFHHPSFPLTPLAYRCPYVSLLFSPFLLSSYILPLTLFPSASFQPSPFYLPVTVFFSCFFFLP